MNIIEAYSRQTGLRIDKIQMEEHFFPLGFDSKYVVITSSTGAQAKNYLYYPIVIDLLKPILNKLNYKIVQIGGKDDMRVGADLDICGRTSIYHLAWIIKNASLVICGDTSSLHIAGHYDIPVVSCFSASDPKVSGAYFGSLEKKIYLKPDNFEPKYVLTDNENRISQILPEKIAKAALDLLNIHDYKLNKTLYIGKYFKDYVLESIPDSVINPEFLQGNLLILRLDRGGQEEIIYEQLKHRKCVIVTNKTLNLGVLHNFRKNIERIIYIIDKNQDYKFAESLYREAFPHQLISFLGKEELKDLREQYVDLPLIDCRENPKKPEKFGTRFTTNRKILSKGKIYLSYAHVRAAKNIDKFETKDDAIIDSPEFWDDLEQYYIYE